MEENIIQDDFNLDLLKDLSIADLKAAMGYFNDEYKFWARDVESRKDTVRMCEETILFNNSQLKKIKNKTGIKKNLIKDPFSFAQDLKNLKSIKSLLSKLIELYSEEKELTINGCDYDCSLKDAEDMAAGFLDKYFLFQNEIANRLSTGNKIAPKTKQRLQMKSIVDQNISLYNNAPRGKKKALVESLAKEHGYVYESLKQEFWRKIQYLNRSKSNII